MQKVTYKDYLSIAQSAIDSGTLMIMKGVQVSMPENIAIELFNVKRISAVVTKTIVNAKITPFDCGNGLGHRIVGRTKHNELVSYIVDGAISPIGNIPLLHAYIKQYCPVDMCLGVENTILSSCRAILYDGRIVVLK